VRESPGKDAKFRKAFDEHFDAITRYCFRRLPTSEANDAAAAVFAVAWRKIDQMPDDDHTLPWLYGVARHEVSTFRRSIRRATELRARLGRQPHYPEPGPETVVVRNAEQVELLRALAALSQADQEVLRLRVYEDLTLSQIAIALGCTPEAAKKRSARAMKRLRKAATYTSRPGAPIGPRAIPKGGDA
jgi:RNA polymerase sigma-70 factor (ECF subfamily)